MNLDDKLFGVKEIKTEDHKTNFPPTTSCYCEDCNWKGVISDCEIDYDQDGWENPLYEVLVCPSCGEFSVQIY